MFLLLGPASIVTTWLIYVTAKQGPWDIAAPVAMILFIFVFFVAAIAALFDQFLARATGICESVPDRDRWCGDSR
jgi:hypothetical protein